MSTTAPSDVSSVMNPVGYVIVSFESDADAQSAQTELARRGIEPSDITLLTPQQMATRAQTDVEEAGVWATIGQDLNLVKALLERANQGNSFLVVHAPKDEQAATVAEVSERFNAQRAQHFGRFVTEELIDVGADDRQVAESPDRGLDAETRSGREGHD